MSLIKGFINAVADPKLFFLLAVVALILVVWKRERIVSNAVGYGALGILAVFHYLPLHLSDMGRRLGGCAGQCPVSEDLSERLLRLPFYFELSEKDQDEVISAIKRFFEG